MQDDNNKQPRDAELDQMLAPLRSQGLSDGDLNQMLKSLQTSSVARRPFSISQLPSASKRALWVPFAFAAGLAAGVSGTLFFVKGYDQSAVQIADQKNSVEEFATVRQVITNY